MYKVLTGAQMYSVRTLTQTQEGLDATLKALKEMGYTLSEEELLAAGITPQTVRLSIGTEHIDDIIDDLKQGFDKI